MMNLYCMITLISYSNFVLVLQMIIKLDLKLKDENNNIRNTVWLIIYLDDSLTQEVVRFSR